MDQWDHRAQVSTDSEEKSAPRSNTEFSELAEVTMFYSLADRDPKAVQKANSLYPNWYNVPRQNQENGDRHASQRMAPTHCHWEFEPHLESDWNVIHTGTDVDHT